MIGNDVSDTIIVVLPSAAAVEAIITTIVDAHRCPFDGVPIVDVAVHWALCLEQLPVSVWTYNSLRRARQSQHIDHAIYDDTSANAVITIQCQEVNRIE